MPLPHNRMDGLFGLSGVARVRPSTSPSLLIQTVTRLDNANQICRPCRFA
jgi:hypothetical protein